MTVCSVSFNRLHKHTFLLHLPLTAHRGCSSFSISQAVRYSMCALVLIKHYCLRTICMQMNKAAPSVVTYLQICLLCSLTIMIQYTCCCHSARYECASMHEWDSMNVRFDSMRQGVFIKGGCSWHCFLISSSPNCCVPPISHSDATQWYQPPPPCYNTRL